MEIVTCFQRLGFNITEKNIHCDLKVDAVKEELRQG